MSRLGETGVLHPFTGSVFRVQMAEKSAKPRRARG